MARRRSRYRGSSYSRSSYANSRREQHVREAEEFSREIGGTDQDVKRYFFSLSGQELAKILTEYGRMYGEKAEAYARTAIPRWKNGTTRMSGQTAKRLFNLLPPRMPLRDKYGLVENLWKKLGPHSHKILKVGVDARPNRVIEILRRHIEQTVDHFKLPTSLENRFKWLAANDVHAQQQLLNHFQELEKTQAVDLFKVELPVLLKHRSTSSESIQSLRKIIEINNHKFELVFLPSGDTVSLEEPETAVSAGQSDSKSFAWVFWLIGVIVLLIIMNS